MSNLLEILLKEENEKTGELDLSRLDLESIPESVWDMTWLKNLILNRNKLKSIPEKIGTLTNLKRLVLSRNLISKLPEELCSLPRLEIIDLSENNIELLPFCFGELRSLKTIYLRKNSLKKLPSSFSQLAKLFDLHLGANELSQFPSEILDLKALRFLYLTGNKIEQIPSEIKKLKNLNYLGLAYNDIEEIPEEICTLKGLIGFHKRSKSNKPRIDLRENPLNSPPIEIAIRGLKAIINFFDEAKHGSNKLFEAKLLIVGEGGSGKTTLQRKLIDLNAPMPDENDSTEGIDIQVFNFLTNSGSPFKVNVWDFGGQEIYHATHQFFLTKRSLYILVSDSRKEDTDFNYWLQVTELLSDGSPLLIVQNEKGDRSLQLNEKGMRSRFTNLIEITRSNFLTKRGLPELIEAIKYNIQKLPHVGNTLPNTWIEIRKSLEKIAKSRNYISLQDYYTICIGQGITEKKRSLTLSQYFHDIGVFLHFQKDSILKNIVILQNSWATNAVYKVLDNDSIKNVKLGRFNLDDLHEIWNDEMYEEVEEELLHLMMKFELCYHIPNSEEYIAPQLLPGNQPDYQLEISDNDFPLKVRYTFDFMPKGIITRFTVRMHRYISNHKLVWKEGVILEKSGSKGEVIETYGKREIRISVIGPLKKDLLTIIVEEMDRILDSYKPRLIVHKLIPCNCQNCINQPRNRHFYEYEDLLRRKIIGKETVECKNSYENVKVQKLIGDIFIRDKRFDIYSPKDYENRKVEEGLSFDGDSLDGEGKDQETIFYLKKMVSKNKLNEATTFLLEIFEKKKKVRELDEVILLQGRLQKLKSQRRIGLISNEEENQEYSKISAGIIELIMEI